MRSTIREYFFLCSLMRSSETRTSFRVIDVVRRNSIRIREIVFVALLCHRAQCKPSPKRARVKQEKIRKER